MTDQWQWWRTALSAPAQIGTPECPIHETDPQSGYYRKKNKDGSFEPVAIWRGDDDRLVCVIGRESSWRDADPHEIWTWVCRYPVDYTVYQAVVEGGDWPDVAVIPGQRNVTMDDSPEVVQDQIEALTAAYFEWLASIGGAIQTQAQADIAADYKVRATTLESHADDLRKAEKKPHWDAGVAVDQKWKPTLMAAEIAKHKIVAALNKWFNEQVEKRKELGEAAEYAPKLSAGKGRKVTPRMRVTYEVTNYADALSHYAEDARFIERVKAVMVELGSKDIAAGLAVPGIGVATEAQAV